MKGNVEKQAEIRWSVRLQTWIVPCERKVYGKKFKVYPKFKKLSKAKDFLKFWLALSDDNQERLVTKEDTPEAYGWRGIKIKYHNFKHNKRKRSAVKKIK